MLFTRFIPKSVQYAYRWDTRAGWLFNIYNGMTLPFYAVTARRHLHASPMEISLLIATPFLGHLLSMFVAWHMQSRAKKPYMFWLAVVARGIILFMAFANTTPVFISLVIASQITGCFMTPAHAALMKDAYPDTLRGRMMGMARVGPTIAAMLAGLIGGRLLDNGLPKSWILLIAAGAALLIAHELHRNVVRVAAAGLLLLVGYLGRDVLTHTIPYQTLFPVMALFGLASAWAFNHMPEAKAENVHEQRFTILDGFTTLFKDKRFGLYSLAFTLFGFGNLLQGPLVPLFQVDELNIANRWVGMLVMVSAGVSALFYGIWGKLMDRYGPLLTVVLSFAICGFAPIVYANAHSVSTLMIASVLMGIANPGIDLTWMNAVMYFTTRDGIPRYTALHTFLVGIRGLLAPFAGAWLYVHFNLRQSFYISAVVIWLGTLFMLAVVLFVLLPAQRARAAQHTTRVTA